MTDNKETWDNPEWATRFDKEEYTGCCSSFAKGNCSAEHITRKHHKLPEQRNILQSAHITQDSGLNSELEVVVLSDLSEFGVFFD